MQSKAEANEKATVNLKLVEIGNFNQRIGVLK